MEFLTKPNCGITKQASCKLNRLKSIYSIGISCRAPLNQGYDLLPGLADLEDFGLDRAVSKLRLYLEVSFITVLKRFRINIETQPKFCDNFKKYVTKAQVV